MVVVVIQLVDDVYLEGFGIFKGIEVDMGYCQVIEYFYVFIGFEQGIDQFYGLVDIFEVGLRVIDCFLEGIVVFLIKQGDGGFIVQEVVVLYGQIGCVVVFFQVVYEGVFDVNYDFFFGRDIIFYSLIDFM